MGKRILIVGQYFYPEQFRINDIATQWVERGYAVEAVTGTPNYPGGKFFPGYGWIKKRKESYNGIPVRRIPQIPRGHHSWILVLNYLSFVVSGFFWKCFTRRRADVVFNYTTSPIFQALPAVWFAKRRHIPCYLYILDMWPHSLEVMTGIKTPFILKRIQKICDYLYRNSTKIFVSSEGFLAPLRERGVPEDKLIFWPQYAEDFYRPLERGTVSVPELPEDGTFQVVFAGNIGFAQGLDILPDVAGMIKEQGCSIRLYLVGDGRYKATLQDTVRTRGLEDVVRFIDRQPAERIPAFLARADAALVTLQKNALFAMTVPAKMQSCMACGVPVVLAADGEPQRIVREADCGLACDAADAAALFAILTQMAALPEEERTRMCRSGRAYFEAHYERERLLDQMDAYLDAL